MNSKPVTEKQFEEAVMFEYDKNGGVDEYISTYTIEGIAQSCYAIHKSELDLQLAEQQTQMNEVAEEMAKERAVEFVEWLDKLDRKTWTFNSYNKLYDLCQQSNKK